MDKFYRNKEQVSTSVSSDFDDAITLFRYKINEIADDLAFGEDPSGFEVDMRPLTARTMAAEVVADQCFCWELGEVEAEVEKGQAPSS